jgi:hypothetical protein
MNILPIQWWRGETSPKIINGQRKTANIGIAACARLLPTSRIKRRSDPTLGSKVMNILLLGGGPAAGVLIVVMFCVGRIKKMKKRKNKNSADSFRTCC